LGGSCHILGLVRLGLRPSEPRVGEVLLGGAVAFFNSNICVSWSELSPPPLPGGAENGLDIRGSDCHSERLDPLLRGQTEQFGGGQTVQPLWGWIVTICKHLWDELLQCWMVRVKVSQCLNGGWPNHQGTPG
jgi:hypothetical protein